MISVVLLNWQRPANVARFVAEYLASKLVGQVLVFNNNPAAPPALPADPRLTLIQSSADLGLYSRFAAAALARFEPAALVDDDIRLPPLSWQCLLGHWKKAPQALHGLFGRRPAADGAYSTHNYFGDVPVVLTRAVLVSRRLCALALAAGLPLLEALPGEPRGNGEDLLLSHLALAEGAGSNHAYDLPYENVGYDDVHAISVRFAGHEAHRTAVVRWCRKHLVKS